MEVKRIEEGQTTFVANNVTYIVHDTMPVGRYAAFERLQMNLVYDKDPMTTLQEMVEVYSLLNQGKLADASVKLHNIMNGAERIVQGQPHHLLFICTCFITKENADRSGWTEAEAKQDIENWTKEQIDVRDFFALAMVYVQHFFKDYRKTFQNSLQETE